MSDELEARARLKTRQSVHDWCKKGQTVGRLNAGRSFVNPAAQLDERNRPMPGLDHVAAQFGDGYARGSGANDASGLAQRSHAICTSGAWRDRACGGHLPGRRSRRQWVTRGYDPD